jgi:hypothetical protein
VEFFVSLIWRSGQASGMQFPVASVIAMTPTWQELSDLPEPARKYKGKGEVTTALFDWHWEEMSEKIRAETLIPKQREHQDTEYDDEWAPEPVWIQQRLKETSRTCRQSTADCPPISSQFTGRFDRTRRLLGHAHSDKSTSSCCIRFPLCNAGYGTETDEHTRAWSTVYCEMS